MMKKYLWQAEDGDSIDQVITDFTAGEDVILDRELFVYDIQATAAHVRGLQRIGILEKAEAKTLCDLLQKLDAEYRGGEYELDQRFEYGHSAIEDYLTSHAGEIVAKDHTGRSLNDQDPVATRLYLK